VRRDALVIPYGIDGAWYAAPADRAASGPGPVRLVTACGLVRDKGLPRLLRALAGAPDTRLTVVGEGPERGRLERLADELGLAGRVAFAGWLPAARMAAVFDRSDVFVLPSPKETLGLVYLEALARRLPIVGVANQGVHGMFPGCRNTAFLGTTFGTAELSAATARLLAQRPFVDCACGRCALRYDKQRTAHEMVGVYRGVLERGG
jgi:glycosyltransferase involved in cell wall biosynthesis